VIKVSQIKKNDTIKLNQKQKAIDIEKKRNQKRELTRFWVEHSGRDQKIEHTDART